MALNKAPYVDFPYHMKTVFDELRVSQQRALFDHSNIYELDSEEYGTITSNGASIIFDNTARNIVLSVSSASSSSAQLRTHTQFRYQSGKGLYVRLSVYHSNAGVANQVRRWGYFDDNDGIFFDLSPMFSYMEHKLRVLQFGAGQETLTITGENISGASATMRSSMNWHEIR